MREEIKVREEKPKGEGVRESPKLRNGASIFGMLLS